MERLQKVIANSGYCSRRKAEEFIVQGRVKVDGTVVTELGTKVPMGADITVNNAKIGHGEEKVYYILNKPRGVITSTKDDKGRETVIDLIKTDKRIYPIGRLDYDTTGLLLLTNDGDFANLMMHPSSSLEKVYIAKIEGILNGEAIYKLKEGIILDDHKIIPKRVKLRKIDKKTNTCTLEIIVHEGLNHEIKRMLNIVGYEVLKLKRERFACLDLGNLLSGEYRMLTPKEVKQLYALANKKTNNKK